MPRPRLTAEEHEALLEMRSARLKENHVRAGKSSADKRNADLVNRFAEAERINPTTDRKVISNRKRGVEKRKARLEQGTAAIDHILEPVGKPGAVFGEDNVEEGILRDDVVCEIQPGRIGVISDVHLPFHDLKITNGIYHGSYLTALEALAETGVDTVVLNGDILDMYNVSSHERIESHRNFMWELDVARKMLAHLRRWFGDKVRIVYREGNHEERFERYVAKHAEQLHGVFPLDELLKLGEHGIEWVSRRAKMTAGKLWIDHGHEWFGGGGVMPARNYRMKALDNIMVGHVHRTSQDLFRKPLDGSFIAGWSVGCLCDLNPHYAARNNWNHGFAMIDLSFDGTFSVQNKIIIDGVVR